LGSFGGKVAGKVKLNKILALLQCNGFPVKNKFVNHQLGPYDEKIDIETANLESMGLITVSQAPTAHDKNVFIYSLEEVGSQKYKNDVIPFISGLPYQNALRRSFLSTKREIVSKKTREIVDNIHKILYLDDVNNFCRRVGEVHSDLSEKYARLQGRFEPSCPICLELAGSVDLAIEALGIIKDEEWTSPYSGKNFVLRNAETIAEYLSGLASHEHIRDPRFKGDRTSELREDLILRYHCIEYNSRLYGIIDHSFFADGPEEHKGLTPDSDFIRTTS
jgi:hypothetical protein